MTSASAQPSGRYRVLPLGVVDARADQVRVRMRDGVRLATDVYLPTRAGRSHRVPTVLVRLPYDKSAEFAFMSQIATRMTERGYAFVAQDVRGKARSEGETRAFIHEVYDGADTLDWVVSQPWSDGAVGMIGDSYYGFTQWAALASGHPALKAIVPRMTTSEIGTDWMYLDGVFNLATMLEWAAHTWVEPSLIENHPDWSVRPAYDVLATTLDGRTSASLETWARTGPDDPYWTHTVYAGRLPVAGRIPTLHVGGFYDVFSRGQLRDFARSLRGSRGVDQHLVMDATDHFDDLLTATGSTVDYASTPALLDAFLDERYLPDPLTFLDAHLRGRPHSLPKVRWTLGTTGAQVAETWPPAGATPLRLLLTGDEPAARGPAGGRLIQGPPALAATVSWQHDPADPAPTLVEDPWRPLLRLPDERPTHVREDVLTFTAEPVMAPLDLAGPVRFTAFLRSSAETTHLVARLLTVAPTGEARLVVEGITLVVDARAGTECVVDLGDTGHRVEPGHRLRLAVSSACYPRWVAHPGTEGNPLFTTRTTRTTQWLEIGSTRTSLVLTVLPAPDTKELR